MERPADVLREWVNWHDRCDMKRGIAPCQCEICFICRGRYALKSELAPRPFFYKKIRGLGWVVGFSVLIKGKKERLIRYLKSDRFISEFVNKFRMKLKESGFDV